MQSRTFFSLIFPRENNSVENICSTSAQRLLNICSTWKQLNQRFCDLEHETAQALCMENVVDCQRHKASIIWVNALKFSDCHVGQNIKGGTHAVCVLYRECACSPFVEGTFESQLQDVETYILLLSVPVWSHCTALVNPFMAEYYHSWEVPCNTDLLIGPLCHLLRDRVTIFRGTSNTAEIVHQVADTLAGQLC